MSKMHLADSAEPLTEGATITALCGAEVERARFVIHWDEDAGEQMNVADLYDAIAMMTCRKCMQVESDHRYIYGVKSAEEISEGGNS